MSANDEMREYLHHLLDHEGKCTIENCATCQIALNVYELIRLRIFLIREYPGPANNANAQVTSGDDSANDTPRTTAARTPVP